MKIEPRAFNAIEITLETGVTFKLTDCEELGLCLVKADHKDIQVTFLDRMVQCIAPVRSDFMVYLQ